MLPSRAVVPYAALSVQHTNDARSSSTCLYKYLGVLLLTLQQASMPLMARSARYRSEDRVFFSSVNVLMMDIIKIALCSTILTFSERSFSRFLRLCVCEILGDLGDTLRIIVPAFIYMVQVAYQMKILTTALLLKLVLNKPLSGAQWAALVLLIAGVVDVQLQYQPPLDTTKIVQRPFVGFVAVLTMCFTSAAAGVYMEKALKQSASSVWVQNIRLSLFGMAASCLLIAYYDLPQIREHGAFRGFDTLVWVMTITNTAGGLLISIVIKYADNIMKAYAQSVAIIGAALGSWLLFDFVPNFMFIVGMAMVIASICLYTAASTAAAARQPRKLEFPEIKLWRDAHARQG